MQKEQIKSVLKTEFSRDRLIVLFIMLIAIIGFISAFRFGGAALDYYFVRNAIELWQNDANLQTEEQYRSAKSAINRAEISHPSHPLYADLSGQLAEWGVVAGYETPDKLSNAKSDYLRAARLRPSWPVTWASLALVKWRLQEFDDEMLNYLNLADSLGAQKPEVHVLFVELGLALYTSNHPFYRNIRDQMQQRMTIGLRNEHSRSRVLAAIEQHNSWELACIWTSQRDTFVSKNILDCDK